jgi:protein involved in sex pheromone biosynthesis
MSKNLPIERIIRAVAKKKIRSLEPFTSVDIANDIKLFGIWISNKNIADRLRKCVIRWSKEEGFEYKQENINVDCGSEGMKKAIVYIPSNNFSSSDYLKRDQQAISPDTFKSIHKTSVMPWNSRNQKVKNNY